MCLGSYFSDDDEGLTKILVILVPCVAVVLLVATMAGVFQIRRNRQTKQSAIMGQTKVQMSALLKEARNYHELPASSVVGLEDMGEGRFGRVYRGEFSAARVPVAVETLQSEGSSVHQRKKAQAEFWAELERLSEMTHPNVTGVVGIVCSDVQQVSIVHEFTSTCNLHIYLNTNARVNYLDGLEKRLSLLSAKDLLNIAIQVSAGMEYLSSLGFVHGDLAARSVLIADGGTVKVSSLRYRNSAYGMDYSLPPDPGRCQPLPVRWLPPEAVFHDQFGSTTDPWSFGIVLWEVYSHGSRPFQGHSDDAVIEMLGRHVVLSRPPDCPAGVFSLMIDCWHRLPPERPDFRRIHGVLQRLRQSGTSADLGAFPSAGHHRTPSINGNSFSSGGGGRQAASAVPPETVSSTETTEVLVPLVTAADPRPHQGPYPTQQYHVSDGAAPSSQTPVYSKRPVGATESSSSQKSSPPSSLCSGQNRCLHPPAAPPPSDRSTNAHDLTARWMRTMYEDVVI